MTALTYDVHAKLTLSLRVTGVRADGFHELDALVVSITSPRDVLTISERSEPGVRCRVDGGIANVPSDESNLAVRAVKALLPEGAGADLLLEKRIPTGAGLGGGSADAGAALVATRHLFALDVSNDALERIAADIGSDVPFCVRGGAAWMRGRGERLEPLPAVDSFPVLVAIPPVQCSTPAVYAAWDRLGGPKGTRSVDAPGSVRALTPTLVNDLEPAAESVAPELIAFREALERAAGAPPLLAGSGSAYVVCFDDVERAEAQAVTVRAEISDAAVFVGHVASEASVRRF